MNKFLFRSALPATLLIGLLVLFDLLLDRWVSGFVAPSLPHFLFAAVVVLLTFVFVSRAIEAQRRAEDALRQARDELAIRVHERTAELEQANAALRTEVTERSRVEHALRTSEETARALMDASPESAMLLNAQGTVLATNETAARRLGVTVERMVGSSLFDFFSPEVSEARRAYLGLILQTRQPLHFVDERDGITFDNHVHPICDAEGKIIRLAVFGSDITERLRAEETLRASEEKYRLLFHNMAEGFGIYELLYDEQGIPADWRILEVNAAYTRLTGIARDRIVGRRSSELVPEAIPEDLPRFAEVVATQTPSEVEIYAEAVGRHLRVVLFPAGGDRLASIIEDITARKQSEERLRLAQAELALDIRERSALEERQRLARELHDSVSQALYGISLGVNTALALFDADRAKVLDALNYALSLAHGGLMEMRALIFELRPESLESEGLVVALSKQVAALRARHGIEVMLDLYGEPDVSLVIKEALFRIAQEALQNAVKHARADRLDVRLSQQPEGVMLDIFDNGEGFDPSATYPGHLGLRSMRERAQSVGGTLEIVSAPGRGTQIRTSISLPTPI